MHNRPSIKDIARKAGVSPSTVSRALAGSTRVSRETRERVQAIAAELGYAPSVAARSLVTGRSQTFGVITPTSDPYVAAVMQGVESACISAGYRLLIASTGGEPAREIEAVRLLLAQQPDGLIVLSSRAGAAYGSILPRLDAPVVFINSWHEGERVFSIATDNEYGGWLATRHLLDLGRRRIAYLGGPEKGRSHRARAAGWRRALAEAGVSFDPDLLWPADGSIEAGRLAVERLLAGPAKTRPTAVFCYNDLSALGLMAEAQARGLTIPGDLSVVGFDNIPFAAIAHPPLTTVDQRKREMGGLAVETLLAALRGEPVASIHLRGELIVRESAGKA
ncbi:MAG: LacI family transcriptional regulator [Chloroflexi bacterium]|nr:LacI family transcriptional regulator [Chloroflexota bacterium]